MYIADGSDFRSARVEVVFAAGETMVSVNISILHDGINRTEASEIFLALLIKSKPDVVYDKYQATITILNRNGELSKAI